MMANGFLMFLIIYFQDHIQYRHSKILLTKYWLAQADKRIVAKIDQSEVFIWILLNLTFNRSTTKRGSKTVKVKDGSDDERRLIELTARIPFDDRLNQTAKIDDLNLRLIQSYLKEVMSSLYEESTKMPFSELCRHLMIAKGSDELLRPTNAGLLLFTEHPEKYFSGAAIELVIHKNEVGKDYTEKIFTGSIIQQIWDVLQYFKSTIVEELVVKSAKQAESIRFFNYPFQAIEEAVVNAVYHKSYERENPVEIQIHKDKIEILSFPGPMPPINQAMLKKQRVIARDYRNRKIGGFLKELKLTEGRGIAYYSQKLSRKRFASTCI